MDASKKPSALAQVLGRATFFFASSALANDTFVFLKRALSRNRRLCVFTSCARISSATDATESDAFSVGSPGNAVRRSAAFGFFARRRFRGFALGVVFDADDFSVSVESKLASSSSTPSAPVGEKAVTLSAPKTDAEDPKPPMSCASK